MRRIVIGFVLLFISQALFSQGKSTSLYNSLGDLTGFDLLDNNSSRILNTVIELNDLILADFDQDFHVYDYGFYYVDQFGIGGHRRIWDELVSQLDESKYYILFARKIDEYGRYTLHDVKINFPENTDASACLNNDFEQSCSREILYEFENSYREKFYSRYKFVESQEEIINTLGILVRNRLECCENNSENINSVFVDNQNSIYLWEPNALSYFHKIRKPYGLPERELVPNPMFENSASRQYPWKYIPVNKLDSVSVNNAKNSSIFFNGNLIDVSSNAILREQSSHSILNKSLEYNAPTDTTIIKVSVNDSSSCAGAKLNVLGSQVIVKDIAFMYVRDSITDTLSYSLDEQLMTSQLKFAYSKVGVEFNKVDFYDIVLPYDLNGDDSLSIFPPIHGPLSAEIVEALRIVSSEHDSLVSLYDGVILLFDKTKKHYGLDVNNKPVRRDVAFGVWRKLTKYGVIYMGNMESNTNIVFKTIAHESGHGIFDLSHPWDRFDYDLPIFRPDCGLGDWCSEEDPENIMGYNPGATSFNRIYQAKKIHTGL